MSELNQEQDLLVNDAKQVQANNCYAASVAQSTGAQESLLLQGDDDESLDQDFPCEQANNESSPWNLNQEASADSNDSAESDSEFECECQSESSCESESEGECESELLVDGDDLDEEPLVTFDSLGLSDAVLKAIKHEGFEQPTPIQLRSIPTFLEGHDMIGQAQTGTGKTAAFALPILSKLPKRQKNIFALVLEPTRELAIQVAELFSRFAKYIDNFRVAPIYGGASYESQIRSLRHGAQVVVATPGRLIDLIEKGRLDFSEVEHIVIDEADEMLRMGFIDDVDWILD